MKRIGLEDLFQTYVAQCSQQLFAEYGVVLRASAEEPPAQTRSGVAGIIGFTGERLKGSLVLASSLALIRTAYPMTTASGADPGSDALVDWTGELANQLLGRIKNRLLLHGVALVMSTPVSVTGEDIAQSRLAVPRHSRVAFESSAGTVVVSIGAEVDGELDLSAEPMTNGELGVAAEGDLVLF